MPYEVGSLVEFVLVYAEGVADAVISVGGEVVEVFPDDGHGIAEGLLCAAFFVHAAQLQHQAFLQRSGAYARGLKTLYDAEHFFDFLFRCFNALAEGEVVGDKSEVAAEVSCVVEASYQLGGYLLLSVGQRAQGQLFGQSVGESAAVAYHKFTSLGVRVVLQVLAVVEFVAVVVGVGVPV